MKALVLVPFVSAALLACAKFEIEDPRTAVEPSSSDARDAGGHDDSRRGERDASDAVADASEVGDADVTSTEPTWACVGRVCVLDCSTGCRTYSRCPYGHDCTILCRGPGSCSAPGLQLECGNGTCNVECSGPDACSAINMIAVNSPSTCVKCTDSACTSGLTMYSPGTFSGSASPRCTIECAPGGCVGTPGQPDCDLGKCG